MVSVGADDVKEVAGGRREGYVVGVRCRAGVPGALDGAETAARLLQLDKVDLTLVQHHAVRSSCVHRSNLHAHAARCLNGRPQPRLACALKRHRAAPSRIATPSSSRDVMTSGQ